jgi:hypothetical protein
MVRKPPEILGFDKPKSKATCADYCGHLLGSGFCALNTMRCAVRRIVGRRSAGADRVRRRIGH